MRGRNVGKHRLRPLGSGLSDFHEILYKDAKSKTGGCETFQTFEIQDGGRLPC